MKLALWFCLFLASGCSRLIPAETGDQHLQRYRSALRALHTVSYQVQRIDTFTR